MRDNLTIVDGNYLMVRCVAANPGLRSAIGEPTGGIFIFLKSLYALSQDSKIVVCFDGGHNKIRNSIYPEYKANRHKDPDDPMKSALEFSFKNILPLLRKIGILTVRIDGEEADDIIYAYSRYYSKDYSVIVASDDSDYLQMVSEDVRVKRPMKNDYITMNNFKEIIGYKPEYHIIYKSLLGDKSDNIPSPCKGFGEKTVLGIVNWLEDNNLPPTLENIKEYIDINSNKKVFQRFKEENGFKNLKRNVFLIDISRIASGDSYNEYIRQLKIAQQLVEPDSEYVRKVFNRFGIKSLPQWILYAKKMELISNA